MQVRNVMGLMMVKAISTQFCGKIIGECSKESLNIPMGIQKERLTEIHQENRRESLERIHIEIQKGTKMR